MLKAAMLSLRNLLGVLAGRAVILPLLDVSSKKLAMSLGFQFGFF
jgi:hypothetical protein